MCAGRRTAPRTMIPTRTFPVMGEKGFMLMEYIGDDEPKTWYGDVTNTPYPFDDNLVRYVDVRDAAFFLGPDFLEL